MEWKIDEVCIEWMLDHLEWYQAADKESQEIVAAFKSAYKQRMRAYAEYEETYRQFFDRLCNNYIIYKSGLYHVSDKSIIITQPDGYLVYQKEKDRWMPIGYLREKHLPYTNKSFVETMQRELRDFGQSVAGARERWIDGTLGSNMRLLRDASKGWVRVFVMLLFLSCDIALIHYLLEQSGLFVWLRLMLGGYVDMSYLFRFSLAQGPLLYVTAAAVLTGMLMVLLSGASLFRDILLIGKAAAVNSVIQSYVELQEKTIRFADKIEGCDLRTLEHELESFKITRHLKKAMPSERDFAVKRRNIWVCRKSAIVSHILLTVALAAICIACMYQA